MPVKNDKPSKKLDEKIADLDKKVKSSKAPKPIIEAKVKQGKREADSKDCPLLNDIEHHLKMQIEELENCLDFEINPIKVIELHAKIKTLNNTLKYLSIYHVKDGPINALVRAILED